MEKRLEHFTLLFKAIKSVLAGMRAPRVKAPKISSPRAPNSTAVNVAQQKRLPGVSPVTKKNAIKVLEQTKVMKEEEPHEQHGRYTLFHEGHSGDESEGSHLTHFGVHHDGKRIGGINMDDHHEFSHNLDRGHEHHDKYMHALYPRAANLSYRKKYS